MNNTNDNRPIKAKRIFEYSRTKQKYDEYYTQRNEVEDIFEKVIGYDFLKDKIIYCPCDGEESEFVKYLKEKKDTIKYKQLIYTSDDFNTHIDLIETADLVITNPPFSKVRQEYFPLMLKHAKYFFFFHSTGPMYIYKDFNVKLYKQNKHYKFNTPYTENYKVTELNINHIYVTNFDCNILWNHTPISKKYDEIFKDKEPVYAKIDSGDSYLCVDKLLDIPVDYDKPIFVPITILFDYYKQYFDIINYKGKIEYSDGRSRYTRFLVKWKNNKEM